MFGHELPFGAAAVRALCGLAAALALGLCGQAQTARPQAEEPPLRLYMLAPADVALLQFQMLDAVNAVRAAHALAPLRLHPALIAAATTHARDMAIQGRPWHFGSDGSSPLTRVQRAGYEGALLGEGLSETYEDELTTFATWLGHADIRALITDPSARDLGFAWFQEANGKLWWVIVFGA